MKIFGLFSFFKLGLGQYLVILIVTSHDCIKHCISYPKMLGSMLGMKTPGSFVALTIVLPPLLYFFSHPKRYCYNTFLFFRTAQGRDV